MMRLKEILSKRGMTQKMLANSLGVTENAVSNWVKGSENQALQPLRKWYPCWIARQMICWESSGKQAVNPNGFLM